MRVIIPSGKIQWRTRSSIGFLNCMCFLLCLREFTTLKLVEDGCFQASIALILSFGVTTHWSNLKLMHLRCYLYLNENHHLPMFEVQFGKLDCKMDRKNYCKFLGKWMRFPSSNLTRIKYLNLIVAFFRKLNCNHSQKTRQASFLLLPSQFICKIGFRLTNHEALKFVKVGLTFVGVIRSLLKYSGAKNC